MTNLTIQFLKDASVSTALSLDTNGHAALKRLLRECEEHNDVMLLREFFSQHPEVGREVFSKVVSLALDFTQSEIRRLTKIKETRDLSEDEKTFAQENVQGLLDKVEQVCLNRL